MIGDLERIGIIAKIAAIIGSGYVLCTDEAGRPGSGSSDIAKHVREQPGSSRSRGWMQRARTRRPCVGNAKTTKLFAMLGGTLPSAVSMNETHAFVSIETQASVLSSGTNETNKPRTKYVVMVFERASWVLEHTEVHTTVLTVFGSSLFFFCFSLFLLVKLLYLGCPKFAPLEH